ncbi:hypothetical protein [Pseudorhodoplanes sp.]|uniref:hypothetical protein n=1 Tax=Pseudorhodoplanes sp. TaxID=1934341 RepID=UPI003D144327
MRAFAIAILLLSAIVPHTRAFAETDKLQQAITYVFTGSIEPQSHIQIAGFKPCVVVVSEPDIRRATRYHLSRFKPERFRFEKRYVGRTPTYQLYVEGDDDVVEFLNPDMTVSHGHRTARFALPGDIETTRRALQLIGEECKPEKQKPLF